MHNSESTRTLPSEILSRIFVLCVRSHRYGGLTVLRFNKGSAPAQIAISHVCSTWRQLALETTELWSNVYIDNPFKENDLHQTWLSRAGSHPLRLTLALCDEDVNYLEADVAEAFWKIVNQVKYVKELELQIYVQHLSQLRESAENKLPYLERVDLRLYTNGTTPVPLAMPNFIMNTRNHYVTFCGPGAFSDAPAPPLLRELGLPWNQLISLNILSFVPLSDCITILKQTSSLETCFLSIDLADVRVEDQEAMVILPSVRTIQFNFGDTMADQIFGHFKFPNLLNLSIHSAAGWTHDTYETIKNQYSLHQLQELKLVTQSLPKGTPSSIVFKDAPLLTRAVMLPSIDDTTLNGLSTGDLGRSLNALTLGYRYTDAQIDAVLEMVRKRSKLVTQGFARDRLEELPSLISEVNMWCGRGDAVMARHRGLLAELKDMGVKVQIT